MLKKDKFCAEETCSEGIKVCMGILAVYLILSVLGLIDSIYRLKLILNSEDDTQIVKEHIAENDTVTLYVDGISQGVKEVDASIFDTYTLGEFDTENSILYVKTE